MVVSAEKSLKVIRKLLGYSKEDFANSLGMTKEHLINIESEQTKLTDKELNIICSASLYTISYILNQPINYTDNKEQNDRLETNRKIITQKLSDFILNYHPMNKNHEVTKGIISDILSNEPINLNDKRRKRKH